MFFSRILVCLTFILMTCTSLGLAQRSEPASNFSVGGQIRVEPGSAIAHYALGRARYKLSEYAEAEQAFTRAALLDKDFEAAELMLLHVYVRQGRLSAALSRMDALLQKNPGNSRNPALEKFRSEVVTALPSLKQGAEKQK